MLFDFCFHFGGVNIAYDVIGDGPRDVVFVCGTMSHLELWWSDPDATEMLDQGLAGVVAGAGIVLWATFDD